jgi:hypothetical protein
MSAETDGTGLDPARRLCQFTNALLRNVNLLFLVDVAQEVQHGADARDDHKTNGIIEQMPIAARTGRSQEFNKVPERTHTAQNAHDPVHNI